MITRWMKRNVTLVVLVAVTLALLARSAPADVLVGMTTNLRVQAAGLSARITNRVYTYYPRGMIGSQTGRWRPLGQAPVPDSTNAFGMAGGVTRVRALHWDHERNVMFAGGTFTNAGGALIDGVAYWDGTAWNRMGGGIGTTRYVNGFLPAPDGKVYAHGFFPTIGLATSWNVGAWVCADEWDDRVILTSLCASGNLRPSSFARGNINTADDVSWRIIHERYVRGGAKGLCEVKS